MPHIAEGLMHAHLDGALGPDGQLEWAAAEKHLEVCPDCRERFVEARELRAKARELLAGATPSLPAGPGFAALAAEAEARRATGGGARWWGSIARLAWAASLVMAAGAGWIGHELLMQRGPNASMSAARSPAAETVDAVAEQAAEPEAGFEADADQAAPARPPAAEAEVAGKAMARQAAPQLDGRAREDVAGPSCLTPMSEIRASGLPGPLGILVLAPDGTLRSEAGGQPLVGFWNTLAADSLGLRLTDGAKWFDYRLRRSGNDLSGVSRDGEAVGFRSTDCVP